MVRFNTTPFCSPFIHLCNIFRTSIEFSDRFEVKIIKGNKGNSNNI